MRVVLIVRRDRAPAINLGGTGVQESLMTPRGQSKLQLVHSTVEPQGCGGNGLNTINCEVEVLHVLKGGAELRFSDRVQRLSAGDALTLAGGEPHSGSDASSRHSAEVVWVLVPAPWSGSS